MDRVKIQGLPVTPEEFHEITRLRQHVKDLQSAFQHQQETIGVIKAERDALRDRLDRIADLAEW
jgi:uncharacterized protein YnzC (UPF0291/DUF896 family)